MDAVSLRRTNEGIEVLCYEPQTQLTEGASVVFFGQEINVIPGVAYMFPLSNFVSPAAVAVPGTINVITMPISSGSRKVGFPNGQSADDFVLDDFAQIARNRYGLSNKVKRSLEVFIDGIKSAEALTGNSEATFEASYTALLKDPYYACLMPNILDVQLEEWKSIEGLSASDLTYLDQAIQAIRGTVRQVWLPPSLISKFYTSGKAMVVGSSILRELRTILFCKLAASLSSAACFSDWLDVKDAARAESVAKKYA